MKILAVAGGSRGDVQPIVALALGMRASGHEVSIAAGSDAAPLIAAHGLPFVDLGVSVNEEMASPAGRRWLTASGGTPSFREMALLRKFYEQCAERLARSLLTLSGTADLFLSGLLTLDAMESIARHDGAAHAVALLSPLHPTADGRAGVAARDTRISWNNRAISHVGQRAFGGVATRAGGRIVRQRLGMRETGARGFTRALARVPTVLGVSPLLTPRPADWPATVHVTGPWTLSDDASWTPPPSLADFLASGPPPVFLGFGSMSVARPERMALIAHGIARRAGVRVVVSGAGAEGPLEDDVVAIGSLPHSWLFPRMSGVVHHGGSGTTHTALLAGTPQLIVPHIGDQPYWGRRVREEGLGAQAIPLRQLRPDRLADGVRTLVSSSRLRARAAESATLARHERGVETALGRLFEHAQAA